MAWVRNHRLMCDNIKFIWLGFILFWVGATYNFGFADSGVSVNPTEIEKEVLDLINMERQKNGLHPLLWDSQLYDAAHGHSEEMASENYFAHTSLNGKEVTDRIRQAGYDDAIASENIGAGQTTAQQIFDDWISNKGLREDMLNVAYCDAAVGHTINEESNWTDYWTLDIGRKSSTDQCPTFEPEPEVEFESESEPMPEATSKADELGFCEKLIERHDNFCKKHPDLCRAALIKCKRSHEYNEY